MTLHEGNALEILPTLGRIADAVLTDLPYRFDDPEDPFAADNVRLLATALMGNVRVGSIAVVFCDTRTLPKTLNAFRGAGWKYLRLLSARRPIDGVVHGWDRAVETAIVLVAPGADPMFLDPAPDFYDPTWESSGHTAAKPLGLFAHIVSNIAAPCATVLDPFMGSGTAGVACAELGRKFVGVEIEPKFFAMASERIAVAHEAASRDAAFPQKERNDGSPIPSVVRGQLAAAGQHDLR